LATVILVAISAAVLTGAIAVCIMAIALRAGLVSFSSSVRHEDVHPVVKSATVILFAAYVNKLADSVCFLAASLPNGWIIIAEAGCLNVTGLLRTGSGAVS
jgi:hypothetical protein